MPCSDGRHAGMDGYGYNEISDHGEPPNARLHILAEETTNSLGRGDEEESWRECV